MSAADFEWWFSAAAVVYGLIAVAFVVADIWVWRQIMKHWSRPMPSLPTPPWGRD